MTQEEIIRNVCVIIAQRTKMPQKDAWLMYSPAALQVFNALRQLGYTVANEEEVPPASRLI